MSGGIPSIQSLASRQKLPFRMVNQPRVPGHDPAMQKHHLVPRQILTNRSFGPLLAHIGHEIVGFDDFRRNGVLLPACDYAVHRTGLPLHRGPHRVYSEMVAERVGQIERGWATLRQRTPEAAVEQAIMRLGLLQRALRKRLMLSGGRRLILNRKDPLGTGFDFSTLDAMAEKLWADSGSGRVA